MAERSDLTTFWEESPRIIEVASPSAEIIMQDLHDTLKSNVEQASENDDSLDNMDDDPLIDSAGKEDLGGGVKVGITSTLQNAQLAFESRITPTSTGTITTANGAGTQLIDSAADFVTDGVERGAVIINFDDQSITEVLEVLDLNNLRTRVLRGGTNNDYGSADNYKIWNIVQCDIEGGNLVAVDVDGTTPISSIFPTAFTQIVRTSSSSATLQEQADIQFASYNGGVTVDVANTTGNAVAGTGFPAGTGRAPSDNLSDALTIADELGLDRFYVIGDLTLSVGITLDGKRFVGQSSNKTTITVPAAATANGCEYQDCVITGTLDGDSIIERAVVSSLDLVSGFIYLCAIQGPVTLGGSSQANFLDCFSLVAGVGTPEIIVGTGQPLTVRNYNGGIKLSGKTGTEGCSVDMNSGQVVIADDNTAGEITLRGVAKWTNKDTYAGTTTVNDELLTSAQLREVWKILGLDKGDPVEVRPTGIDSDSGDIDINFTGDGITLTRQVRQ